MQKKEPCNYANHVETSTGDLGCVLMGLKSKWA